MTKPNQISEQINDISNYLTPSQRKRLERKVKKNANNEQPTYAKTERHHQNKVSSIRQIIPKTQTQKYLLECLEYYNQNIIFGPAGTGKTFCSTTFAAQSYIKREVDKIVITRPTVAVETSIGFFPGTLEEKMSVWLAETIGILKQTLGSEAYEIAMKHGDIEIVPFEVIRGRSLNKSFILLTEAQNTTAKEMKAFVTRTGEDSRVIIDGDINQSDIGPDNGLVWCLKMVKKFKSLSDLTGVVEFNSNDIVRSGLCGAWVKAIESSEKQVKELVYHQ